MPNPAYDPELDPPDPDVPPTIPNPETTHQYANRMTRDYLINNTHAYEVKKAKEDAAESVCNHVDSFTGAASSGYLGKVSDASQEELHGADYEKLREDTIIYGSPESVIEKIKYMEEVTGADSLILHFPPYNSREQNARVLAQFAEDVIPKFR